MRVGLGFDIHKLREDGKLFIGGVEIDSKKGAVAHSDGDVLLHALTDAILGAATSGDMGEFFPSSDPKFKNIRSEFFVRKIVEIMQERDLAINNVDTIIFLESPNLSNYKSAIRENLAKLLNISFHRINIKAKTMQGLGEIGAENAVAASVVVTLKKFGEPD